MEGLHFSTHPATVSELWPTVSNAKSRNCCRYVRKCRRHVRKYRGHLPTIPTLLEVSRTSPKASEMSPIHHEVSPTLPTGSKLLPTLPGVSVTYFAMSLCRRQQFTRANEWGTPPREDSKYFKVNGSFHETIKTKKKRRHLY